MGLLRLFSLSDGPRRGDRRVDLRDPDVDHDPAAQIPRRKVKHATHQD